MSLFVDTSVWYAAADAGDRSNERARQILSGEESLVTSDHVLLETWLLLHHRMGWQAAERFWDALRSGVAALEAVNAADMEIAWAIGQMFSDQDFSLADRTSFAIMQRLGIHRAAAFDSHFSIYRFGPGRRKSFDVVC